MITLRLMLFAKPLNAWDVSSAPSQTTVCVCVCVHVRVCVLVTRGWLRDL